MWIWIQFQITRYKYNNCHMYSLSNSFMHLKLHLNKKFVWEIIQNYLKWNHFFLLTDLTNGELNDKYKKFKLWRDIQITMTRLISSLSSVDQWKKTAHPFRAEDSHLSMHHSFVYLSIWCLILLTVNFHARCGVIHWIVDVEFYSYAVETINIIKLTQELQDHYLTAVLSTTTLAR